MDFRDRHGSRLRHRLNSAVASALQGARKRAAAVEADLELARRLRDRAIAAGFLSAIGSLGLVGVFAWLGEKVAALAMLAGLALFGAAVVGVLVAVVFWSFDKAAAGYRIGGPR